jgi:outer membrane protein OmpA-like peptidoglycan-associated protein
MNPRRLIVTSVALALSGCITSHDMHEERPATNVSVGWIKNVKGTGWGTCDVAETCAHPTPKTKADYVPPRITMASLPPSLPPAPVSPPTPAPPKAEVFKLSIHFRFAQSDLTPEGIKDLQAALPRIQEGHVIELSGYTDDIGSQLMNDLVAAKRASKVKQWLVAHNVKNPITATGYGLCCYVAGNESAKDRAANRRVEVSLKGAEDAVPQQSSSSKSGRSSK